MQQPKVVWAWTAVLRRLTSALGLLPAQAAVPTTRAGPQGARWATRGLAEQTDRTASRCSAKLQNQNETTAPQKKKHLPNCRDSLKNLDTRGNKMTSWCQQLTRARTKQSSETTRANAAKYSKPLQRCAKLFRCFPNQRVAIGRLHLVERRHRVDMQRVVKRRTNVCWRCVKRPSLHLRGTCFTLEAQLIVNRRIPFALKLSIVVIRAQSLHAQRESMHIAVSKAHSSLAAASP